jgi:cardiolipin synthase
MDHDEEIALAIIDPGVTATLDAHYDDDLTRSRPIDLERWRSRSTGQRVLEQAVQPVRRWL